MSNLQYELVVSLAEALVERCIIAFPPYEGSDLAHLWAWELILHGVCENRECVRLTKKHIKSQLLYTDSTSFVNVNK